MEKEVKKTNNNVSQTVGIRRRYIFLAGVLLGMLMFLTYRFAMVKTEEVHYHADFALYVNGQKDEFKSFTFYEEVEACDVHDDDNATGRAHMHDKKAGVVHVHAHGVTWGQFFENLGYTLGDNVIATDKGIFGNDQDGNKLSFILNGSPADHIANRVIKTEDVLLINYGKEHGKTIQERASAIPRQAHEANVTSDPAACSGSEKLTFIKRLKAALGLK